MNQADLVLYNGNIHTMDPRTPTAEAIAIVGDRVRALGDALEALAGRSAGD